MAKAKKTAPTDDATAAPKKKAAPKGKKPAPAVGSPMVDTALAAAVAAKQLAAGLTPPAVAPASAKESAAFKQFKQSLTKPATGGLDSMLDKTAGPGSRKSDAPFAGPRGNTGPGGGRNQTFGADVNRAGVPRRTSGG